RFAFPLQGHHRRPQGDHHEEGTGVSVLLHRETIDDHAADQRSQRDTQMQDGVVQALLNLGGLGRQLNEMALDRWGDRPAQHTPDDQDDPKGHRYLCRVRDEQQTHDQKRRRGQQRGPGTELVGQRPRNTTTGHGGSPVDEVHQGDDHTTEPHRGAHERRQVPVQGEVARQEEERGQVGKQHPPAPQGVQLLLQRGGHLGGHLPEEDSHPHHEQQRQHHDEQERAPPTVGVAHAHTDRQTQDDRPADAHDDEPDRPPPIGGFGDVCRQRQTQHGQQCATRGGNDPSQQQNQVRRTEDRDEVPGDENKEGDQGHPLTVRMPGQVQKDGPTDPEHDREDRDQQAGTPHTHTQIQRDQIQDPADDQLHHAHHEGDRREQVHTLVQYGNAPQD